MEEKSKSITLKRESKEDDIVNVEYRSTKEKETGIFEQIIFIKNAPLHSLPSSTIFLKTMVEKEKT